MARSSRRTQHLVGSRTLKEKGATINAGTEHERIVDVYEVKSLCGEKYSSKIAYGEDSIPYGYAKHEWAVDTCTACQSKFYARKLREMNPPFPFKMLDRVDMSAEPLPYGLNKWTFKSVYPVVETALLADDVEDRIVGFICIESGWGKSWAVYTWQDTTTMGDMGKGQIGEPRMGRGSDDMQYTPGPHYPGGERPSYKRVPKNFSSKEAALLEFPYMMEAGVLKTRQQVIRAAREYLGTYQDRERQREQERAEREAERARLAQERQTKREALLSDIREVLANDNTSNFIHDVIWRTAREAGFTEQDLYGSKAWVGEEEPASAPLAGAAPSSEPVTDEWGEVIG